MNPEHHNLNTGGGQPPGNSEPQSQRPQASQPGQSNNLPPTTSATDLRVNSASAAVNVALSSVAKYWVFTNLFPGPIPQVSVYGLPTGARIENGKPVQDPLSQSHASILNGDPNIILGHHSSAQTPVSVTAGSGQQLPVSQIIAAQSGQSHESLVGHGQQQELSNQQSSTNSGTQGAVNSAQSSHQQQGHHSQQHIMQQQLMASARPDHTNQQVIDSVVRIEQATGEPANILVTHNPDGTTSIEASAVDPLIVKDEKNTAKIETAQFAIPADIKDIKTAIDLKSVGAMGMEGAVVKISTGASEHDMHAMYKVNVEDLSQLLAYHEVFGKLNSEGQQQTKQVIGEVEVEAGTSGTMNTSESPPGAIGGHHTCDICGKMFQYRYQLIVHRRYHGERKPFTCQACGQAFANHADLTRHGKCHIGGDRSKRMSQDKPYACTTCHKTFARKEHLDNHVRSHTGETPYRCQYCAKTFTRKEHMVNHVRKHTGETPHRCDICKKSFTRKEHFMNHVMWHTGETPHRCDFCSKTFTRKEHLLNHVRQHTGESPHRCNFCSKSFTRREHLVNHVRQHTGETPFQCGYCPKAFTRKDHLVNHVRQHTGESPHKCSYCTKSFTRKEHLTNHVRQHTGESPHRCTYCSKSFTRKEHLTNHIRIHTGESPHRCEFCQKTFTRKEHLTNHLKQHTGDTPHTCKVCSKPFTRKEHLVTHMRSHSCGERPFSCGECGKSFPLKGNLLFHERSHNKGAGAARPFRCDICAKDFLCKGHLVSHRRSHGEAATAEGVAAAPAEGGPAEGARDAAEPVDDKCKVACEIQAHRHERKPLDSAPSERVPNEGNVTQNQTNATVMQITNQVRSGGSSGGVSGSFARPAAGQHHAPAAIAHHPVTVNY